MSVSIAAKAERGAHELVDQAEQMLRKAIAERDRQTPFLFPNTVYYLPLILGQSAKAVEKLADLEPVLFQARELLAPGTPRAGQVPNQGLAALLAAEAIEALSHAEESSRSTGQTDQGSLLFNNPISDGQVRTWGVHLADGRMPGLALLLGRAKDDGVAMHLVGELQRQNVLCMLGGRTNDRGIIDQVEHQGTELGDSSSILLLGRGASSAVHAVGFVVRCAMKLGGIKPGQWPEILKYSKRRTPGFVLALGELSDTECALALAARDLGFAVITDTAVSDAAQVVSVPFETIAGRNDAERAELLIQKCIAARALKLKTYGVSLPLNYGPAFEQEVIGDANLQIQFGGGESSAFELLQTAAINDLTDGKIEVIGPDLLTLRPNTPVSLGMVVRVAGKKLKTDYEPFLEHQIDAFLNYASGVKHIGSGDAVSIRISKMVADKAFTLRSLGQILHARFHEEFAASVEKVEITLITEPKCIAEWREKSRDVHEARAKRVAGLTDSQVDEFYVCTNCRSFAPNNVSIISPERVSPCGECTWLDAKASFELSQTKVRRPVKPGKPIDIKMGIWEGTNKYAETASHGRIKEVALYSLMQSPMCACGDFECIVMLIPEANGVMVVAHEDTSPTPAGTTVATFSAIAAGEQIPGVVGIGKSHLLSPKFISADGGFKRVVWMSSILKKTMSDELRAVCVREGDPELLNKIADEHHATTVQELISWLKDHKHPALEMKRMF